MLTVNKTNGKTVKVSASASADSNSPSLALVGSHHGVPSLADITALCVSITGQQPTQDELDQAMKILAG